MSDDTGRPAGLHDAARLMLLHKHRTSGRVRYACFPWGVIAFEALPDGAVLREAPDWGDETPVVAVHPAALLRAAEQRLGLSDGAIAAEAEFHAWVDTPAGEVPVVLGSFTAIDPPFAEVEALGGRFIAITECRRLPSVDVSLMRRAYECVLG